MKVNNKGYTLVEVLIVVLIITILTPLVTSSVSQITAGEISKAAETTASLYSYARVSTVSGKSNSEMQIVRTDDGYYGKFLHDELEEKSDWLCDASTEITILDKDGNYTAIGEKFVLVFDLNGALSSPTNIEGINFKSGYAEVEIQIVPETGYHKVVNK